MLSNTQKVDNPTFNVNTICELIHAKRTVILGQLVYTIVLLHQQRKLEQDLGTRYTREKVEASFLCPVCGGRLFTRKGKRPRVFKSVIGRIILPILQVRCLLCQHRFCPYKEEIALSFRDRISQTLKQRQLQLTLEVSYRKAQRFIECCLGSSLCPRTIRREIDRQADLIRTIPVSAENEVVYFDSTKVPAGAKARGVSLHIAVTAQPGKMIGRRATMRKRLLFLKTGNAAKVKTSLKSLKARGIVHDGDMDVAGCAPLVQRCLWHLPHQLGHFLWEDGLALKARGAYVKELVDILHLTVFPDKMSDEYRCFLDRLLEHGLVKSYVHLKNAESELTTSRENGFDYHSTCPVEREIREINRRVDIGVRWSIPGVENLLLLKMHNRLNKPER